MSARWLVVIAIPLMLAGCPAVMRCTVKNDSDAPLVVYLPGNDGSATKVPSRGEKEMFWEPGCVTVVSRGKVQAFDGFQAPSGAVRVHMFSTSVELQYLDGQLSYVDRSGFVVNLPKIVTCDDR